MEIFEYKDHVPVMLNEVLEYLKPQNNLTYVDATFGAGGYSNAILNSCNCNVIGIDRDPTTIRFANKLSEKYNNRFNFIQSNFVNINEIISNKVDGFIFDLGVSSMQIDNPDRGFSFQKNAKLDMRMGKEGISAFDVVNNLSYDDLSRIIYEYGEERFSRKIAQRIIEQREIKPIETCFELAEIVRKIVPKIGKIDPATKTFQAIRIYVNDEINSLKNVLKATLNLLNYGGKLLIVSFHGIEDKVVKEFFIENSDKKVSISKYSKIELISDKPLKIINKKIVKPSDEEIIKNPRARSARLRVAEKIK